MDDRCLGGASVLAVNDHITWHPMLFVSECLVGWIRGLCEGDDPMVRGSHDHHEITCINGIKRPLHLIMRHRGGLHDNERWDAVRMGDEADDEQSDHPSCEECLAEEGADSGHHQPRRFRPCSLRNPANRSSAAGPSREAEASASARCFRISATDVSDMYDLSDARWFRRSSNAGAVRINPTIPTIAPTMLSPVGS